MSPTAAPAFKNFLLDPHILGPKSAASLETGGTKAPDVVLEVAANLPFPIRPHGVIELTDVGLNASGGLPMAFQGDPVSLGSSFSAGATAGAAVYDHAKDAVAQRWMSGDIGNWNLRRPPAKIAPERGADYCSATLSA